MKRLISLISITALLGQGCFFVPASPPDATSELSGAAGGYTSFRNGFGLIPGPSPVVLPTSNVIPRVTWTAKLPSIPKEVTVLRQSPTLPNTALLQNLTTALRIPAGTLEAHPVVQSMVVSWKDEGGFLWSYDAAQGRVSFEQGGAESLTVHALPDDNRIISAAQAFLDARGISRMGWGEPALAFSWNTWWFNESKNGTCMTSASVATIQNIAKAGLPAPSITPKLPLRSETSCVREEFPDLHSVEFQLTKDEQGVFGSTGSHIVGAFVTVRSSDLAVVRGWFDIEQDVERSNYPALTEGELTAQFLLGGTGGFGGIAMPSSVDFTAFESGVFAHKTSVDGIAQTFYIPAIRAKGTALFGTKENPIRVIVPLLKADQYDSGN